MPSGKIKYFNKEKGYGFITQDSGGRDVFIHISHIRIHQREIVEGQRVEYEIAIGPKGPEAREVVVFQEIEPKSETSETLDRGRKTMPPKRKKFPAKKPRPKLPKPPTPEIKPKEKPPKEQTSSQPKLPKPPVIFLGEVYMRNRVEDKETMVLALYNHELLACKLHNINPYDLEVMVDNQVRKIIKTDIKYCYKQADEELVKAGIEIDEQLKAQGLMPIVKIKERFEVRGHLLRQYSQAQIPVTLIMREGEIISGLIEWKDHYNCKVKLSTGASILLFRHALYGFSAPDLPQPL